MRSATPSPADMRQSPTARRRGAAVRLARAQAIVAATDLIAPTKPEAARGARYERSKTCGCPVHTRQEFLRCDPCTAARWRDAANSALHAFMS
ncbi:MAG: hypothetical protein ABSE69_05135 [Roseiarcus sp.]